VAADGANSFVRRGLERRLGTATTLMSNRFIWYGTTRRFETLSQTFVSDEAGAFNAHHYRYAPGMSTFIVETDAATWARAGFARMNEAGTRAYCERIFARTWADIHWSRTGRSGASSPGSPTRAGRPATGCWSATRPTPRTSRSAPARALPSRTPSPWPGPSATSRATCWRPCRPTRPRRPIVDKIVAAADASAGWYECFADHMALPPWPGLELHQRSGRVDVERLAQVSPRFVAGYRARTAVGPSR